MKKRDSLSALDCIEPILEALKRMFDYIDDVDETEFLNDTLVQDAVLYNLGMVEAAACELAERHPAFIRQHADIAWGTLCSIKQRIAHHYFNVDFKVMWSLIEQDLPILGEQIQEMKEAVAVETV